MYSSTTGLDVIADNRSGCIRRPQVWMYSPATGLDVFADSRSRRDGCTGRRAPGASGPESARTRDRGHPRPLSAPRAAPHLAAAHTRLRRRQATATAHGRRAQRTGTCRAGLERPARTHARARAVSRSPAPAIRSRGRAALHHRSHSSAQAPGGCQGSRAPRATRGHMQGSPGAPGARVHGFFLAERTACARFQCPHALSIVVSCKTLDCQRVFEEKVVCLCMIFTRLCANDRKRLLYLSLCMCGRVLQSCPCNKL